MIDTSDSVVTKLSDEKFELLAYLLEEEGIDLPERQIIPRRKEGDQLPLSFSQQRLWFIDQLQPNNPAYNLALFLRVTGPLNVPVLERCLNEIVRRHEALRTTFPTVRGQPVQRIAPPQPFPLPRLDLCELPEPQRETELLRLAAEADQQPFD